jgi:ADP-glucose pyrophosphorylase
VAADARVTGSVLLPGCTVGAGARLTGAILSPGVQVAAGAQPEAGSVFSDGEAVAA